MKRLRSIVLLVALLGASVWVQYRPGDWIESVRETLFDSYQRLQPRPVPAASRIARPTGCFEANAS